MWPFLVWVNELVFATMEMHIVETKLLYNQFLALREGKWSIEKTKTS